MALNILLCRFIDALIQTDTNVADLIRVDNIIENVKTAKTMTQVCREIVHHNNLSEIPLVVDVVVLLLSVGVNILSLTLLVLRKTSSSKLTLKKN